ncbi:MAG: P27 family phage terminase small subunit [Candidatus Hydrogenedentes bacterium]|nr:P27 family phage terminase small subunit [Candidatus Hydrogenedentota bacterium]
MKGRKPKPVAVKAAEGNRGKRKAVKAPTEDTRAVPSSGRPPAWMPQTAKAMYARCVMAMRQYPKLFTTLDEIPLEVAAVHYAMWREAAQRVMGSAGEKGEGVQSAMAVEARQQAAIVHRILSEFGFTPAARVRLALAGEDEGDALEALLAPAANG